MIKFGGLNHFFENEFLKYGDISSEFFHKCVHNLQKIQDMCSLVISSFYTFMSCFKYYFNDQRIVLERYLVLLVVGLELCVGNLTLNYKNRDVT